MSDLLINADSIDEKEQIAIWEKYLNTYIPSVFLFSVYLSCVMPIIGKILIGSKFHEGLFYLNFILTAVFFNFATSSIHVLGVVRRKMKIEIAPIAIASIFMLTLLLTLLDEGNVLRSISMFFLISSFAAFVTVYIITVYFFSVKWPYRMIARGVLYSLPLLVICNRIEISVEGQFSNISLYISVITLYSGVVIYNFVKHDAEC